MNTGGLVYINKAAFAEFWEILNAYREQSFLHVYMVLYSGEIVKLEGIVDYGNQLT